MIKSDLDYQQINILIEFGNKLLTVSFHKVSDTRETNSELSALRRRFIKDQDSSRIYFAKREQRRKKLEEVYDIITMTLLFTGESYSR